jgi:hypothetical protein
LVAEQWQWMEVKLQTPTQFAAAAASAIFRAAANHELRGRHGWWNTRRRRPEKVAEPFTLSKLKQITCKDLPIPKPTLVRPDSGVVSDVCDSH